MSGRPGNNRRQNRQGRHDNNTRRLERQIQTLRQELQDANQGRFSKG